MIEFEQFLKSGGSAMGVGVGIPRAFILRRVHSLVGLWLVVYLVEHLWVNAQAGLYGLDGARRFIHLVNKIHALPYLHVIEFAFLALPFCIHGLWGILYAWQAAPNSEASDGRRPALPQYERNKAYTWQRITAWLLVVGIAAHVVHMRFVASPDAVAGGGGRVCIALAPPLLPLLERWGAHVYRVGSTDLLTQETLQRAAQGHTRVCVVTPTVGAAFFLRVWATFVSPPWVLLYSFLVIAASYHAFNGLWTLLITWGVLRTRTVQKWALYGTRILMACVCALGLVAIWGIFLTYRLQMLS